jgi:NAD(P)-dependent dehydrogenase (short-subunit alcohol dehydrogenase family)
VTGAGSGIGRACARRLAADGAAVAAVDRQTARAEETAALITANGEIAVPLEADVSSAAAVEQVVQTAVDRLGGLDIIVTAAGVIQVVATHEMDPADWDRMLAVNLTGTFLPVRFGLPHLMREGGAIVTIASVAAVVAGGASSSYDASKGGVLQFTRAVGAEYAVYGVRANCVCPGRVQTSLRQTSQQSFEATGAAGGALRVDVPIDRAADPAEIAAAVAFLCSDDASFMTGSAVMADGGYTAV